jgi:hypothetical protein
MTIRYYLLISLIVILDNPKIDSNLIAWSIPNKPKVKMSDISNPESKWRALANESVATSDETPAVILTLTEPINNARGAKAKKVSIEVVFDAGVPTFTVENDGNHMNMSDWYGWAAWAKSKATTTDNVYGQGWKMWMAKLQRVHSESDWIGESRAKGSPILQRTTGPFMGPEHTNKIQDISDPAYSHILPNGGVRWTAATKLEYLGNYTTVPLLFKKIRELILSRYPRFIDEKQMEFTLRVSDLQTGEVREGNSLADDWCSLKALYDKQGADIVKKLIDGEKIPVMIDDSVAFYVNLSLYHTHTDRSENIRSKMMEFFPLYGDRSQKSSRIHLALDGRVIEARHIFKIFGVKDHNNCNGYIAWADFIPATEGGSLPDPATTKVVFQDECPKFIKAKEAIMAAFNASKPTGGWKNLDWPRLLRRVRTPVTTPPESDRESVVSAPEPQPTGLAAFGITIKREHGEIKISRTGFHDLTFKCSNTESVVKDILIRAARATDADAAFERCKRFVDAYTP